MSTLMSILRKKPRHEVISVRLNEDRLKLLERYQKLLTDQLGRPVSLAEAAFLVIEERVVGMDREATRHEMLKTPTESLYYIRKTWESQHGLTSPQWDVLAEYVQIGSEEESQEPPLLRPAIPSRESYLALLDAFEAVYQNRKGHASKHTWDYFGNLDGYSTKVKLSDNDAEQRHRAVLKQMAYRKELLQPEEKWERPGNIGWCFSHRDSRWGRREHEARPDPCPILAHTVGAGSTRALDTERPTAGTEGWRERG